MSDDMKDFYENEDANEDSKSDAKVILFLIIVVVIAATFGLLDNKNYLAVILIAESSLIVSPFI